LTKKKRRKKEGIAILGLLVGGVTIAVGVGGKAEGQIVEPEKPGNGNGNGGKSKRQLCIEAGGVFNEQFQICEFPEKPEECGPAPPLPSGPGVYWQSILRKQDIGWATELSRKPAGTIVLVEGGFSRKYLDWLRCRQRTGLLSGNGGGGTMDRVIIEPELPRDPRTGLPDPRIIIPRRR